MSVNFNSSYGMMNSSMMNGMMNQGGNAFQSIASQYNCPTCYQYGPVPYNYQTFVNPLPRQAVHPSWLGRFISKIFG